ncbi:MAG: hypothetical protein JST50_23465 [Bacteroidetes bacterium]|jgi:hypothetical protein|nr:hypothetical protein [Bacteroidota bacterium]
MLAHLIPHKGKGGLVLALPLIVALMLFTIADVVHLNEQYIGAISLLSSAFIIWFYDGGPELLREGPKRAKKSKNTLFWIEIKYWALISGIIGCVWLSILTV